MATVQDQMTLWSLVAAQVTHDDIFPAVDCSSNNNVASGVNLACEPLYGPQ